MTANDVVLWDAEDLLAAASSRNGEYITDVFRSGSAPPPQAIAVVIGEPADGHLLPSEDGPWIVGLAVVNNVRGVSQGKPGVTFDPWVAIEPIPLPLALSWALGTGADGIDQPRPLQAIRLTRTQGSQLLDVLRAHDPAVGPWIDEARRPRPITEDPDLQAKVETRDAVRLAANLAQVEVPGSAIRRHIQSDAESLLESVLKNAHKADFEDNLIPDDLRRFDGFTQPEMYSASTAVFRSKNFQLTVFDVNRKSFENVLGVDLIYWDVTHDTFTMVQYKRFERQYDGSGLLGRWAYHRKEEIAKQLAQMPKLTNSPTTSHDWRMTQSPFWFKFVNGDAARTQDGRLLRGMYVPADYLRLAMEDGSLQAGPNQGFRIDYDTAKNVDRDTFARLVRQGLIGTMSEQSLDMHKIIADLTKEGKNVVLAAKTKWDAASQ